MVEEPKIERKQYSIGDKIYYLWDDFDFDEKDWLDVVYNKLTGKGNEVSGSFTKEEIIKTLSILLRNEDGTYCDKKLLRKTRESMQAKIIADFFLSKALLGIITTNFSKFSELEKSRPQMNSVN